MTHRFSSDLRRRRWRHSVISVRPITHLFPRLVLGWIEADFRVLIRIFQHFSKSTRISSSRDQILQISGKKTFFCKVYQNYSAKFRKFSENQQKRSYFDILAVFYIFIILVLCWIFAFSFWNLRKSAASKRCTVGGAAAAGGGAQGEGATRHCRGRRCDSGDEKYGTQAETVLKQRAAKIHQ